MAEVYTSDDILLNILVRLPGKPLLRFRCVTVRWNALISDPCFMKSRSRRMILLPNLRPLASIDDNVPVENEAHSTVRLTSSPLEHHEVVEVTTVGTLNGIVLLVLTDSYKCSHMYLYNPLTRAYKKLFSIDRPSPSYLYPIGTFGFGYGATADDLKIVRFGVFDDPHRSRHTYTCDVFNLKTSSWSTPSQHLKQDFFFWSNVGLFLNGYLYWVTLLLYFGVLALNVEEMVFSKIDLPCRSCKYQGLLLGSLNGCLCMMNRIDDTIFNMWVMKQHNSWLKMFSFTLGLEADNCFNDFHPMLILGNGNKILFTNGFNQLVIYDTTQHSYDIVNSLASHDDFKAIRTIADFQRIRAIEYVESLVSPSDICSI